MSADLQSAAAAVGGIKGALDAAQALVNLVGSGKAREQALKLYGEITAAHERTLAAQHAQASLTEEIADLKAQLRTLEAQITERNEWEREQKKYEFTRLSEGYESFGYTLKPNAGVSEAQHTLCPHCFESHKKRVLSGSGSSWGVETLKCSDCGFETKVRRPTPDSGYR